MLWKGKGGQRAGQNLPLNQMSGISLSSDFLDARGKTLRITGFQPIIINEASALGKVGTIVDSGRY